MPGRAELCSEHRPGFSVSLIFTSTGHSLRGFPLWGTDGVSEPAKVRAKPDRSVLTVVLPSPSTQLGMASHLPLGHLPKTVLPASELSVSPCGQRMGFGVRQTRNLLFFIREKEASVSRDLWEDRTYVRAQGSLGLGSGTARDSEFPDSPSPP